MPVHWHQINGAMQRNVVILQLEIAELVAELQRKMALFRMKTTKMPQCVSLVRVTLTVHLVLVQNS
jgi:hypothetical protein